MNFHSNRLIYQGFPIKKKHRNRDTVSYHNYGAFMVGVQHCVKLAVFGRRVANRAWYAEHTSSPEPDQKEKADFRQLFLVGVTGLEPAASCSQSTRATNCATPRKIFIFLFCLSFCPMTGLDSRLRARSRSGKTTLSCFQTPRAASLPLASAPKPRRCRVAMQRSRAHTPKYKIFFCRAYYIIAE